MNETEELMGLIPEGMFENSNELESFINQQGMQGVYDLLPSGMFGSASELEEAFGSKKKEPSPSELTPSQSPEEVAAGVQEAVGSVPFGAEPSPFAPDDPYGYTQDTPVQTGVEVVREVDTDFKPIADAESTRVDVKGPGEKIDEPEPEEDRLFEMSMAAVTPDLIDAPDDRDTAKELNYQFGRYGFEFTTTPMDFHDQVTVKSADGAEIQINLDPVLDIGRDEETEKLRDFLRRHKMQSQALTQAEQGYEEARLQFGTRKQIDNEVSRINTVENDYRTLVNSYAARVDSINQKYTAESIKANPAELEQYKADMASLEEDRIKLLTMGEDLDAQAQDLERAAGEFIKLKEGQSTVLGFGREALSRGTAGMFGEPVSLLIDAASQIIPLGSGPNYQKGFIEAAQEMGVSDIPEELFATEGLPTINGAPVYTPEQRKAYDDWYASLSKDNVGDVRDKMRDQMAKGLKYNPEMGGMVDAAYEGVYRTLGDRKFNEEAYVKAQEGFLGRTVLSLLESVPAFIGRPGGNAAMKAASRFARMENQVAGQVDREFRADPELAKVSEGEKLLLKKTIGLTVGALEQFGFRNALGRSGVLNGILMRVINKAPVGVKGKAFRDLVQQEVKSATARGLIATGTAALAEAETEFVQTYAEVGAKDIYNALKGKEMFKNADTFSKETFFQAMEAAASGAIGGAVLGTPGSIAAAATTYDFTTLDDATLATFEFLASPGNRGASKQMFVADLKNKVNRGEMTGQQAKDAETNYERVVQAYDGMREVEGMTIEEKKQVLGLEVRRQELISRKEATAAPFQGRIDREISDINIKIQDALQEREATPVDVGERARDSEAVDGEVREEEAVVTPEAEEEVIPEATAATNQDRKAYDGGTIEAPRFEQILSGVADKVRSKGRMTAFQSRLLTENRERVDRLVELKDQFEADALREEAALDETIETLAPNVESRRVTTDALSVIQNRVLTRAKAAAKSISLVAPDVQFVLHETTSQYNRATGYSGAGVFDGGKVHINLELANNRTVAHETLHAIIRSADGMTLKATQEVTKRMATSLSKSLDKGSELKKRLDKFLSQYDENIRDEEQVAELFGYVADGYANLEAPQKSIIRRYVEKLAEAVGIKLPSGWGKQDEDVIDFLNTVSRKVTEGEVITEEEVSVARSTDRQQTEDNLGAAEQRVDDFSDEQIQAMADEGVIFHFSDVDITKVLPEKLVRFALGYGFYFTNYALENSVYRSFDDRFTMVNNEDFNLLDGDQTITDEQAKAIRDAAKMELEEMGEYDDYLLRFEIEQVLISLSETKAGEKWVNTFTNSRSDDRSIIEDLVDEQLEVPTRIVQEMLGFDGVVYGSDIVGKRAGAITVVWNFPKIDRAIIEPGQEPRAAEQRVDDLGTSIGNSVKFAEESTFDNKIEFKRALQERFNQLVLPELEARYGITDSSELNDNLKEYLVDAYMNETLNAIAAYPDALGWYDSRITGAMSLMSLLHPELATDPDAASAFKIGLAITSNGNKVYDNFVEANRQYKYYKENGRFDESRSIGNQVGGILSNLKFANEALGVMSMAELTQFLTTNHKVGSLSYRDSAGKKKNLISGFGVNEEVYGAAVFGPKIGNGFFMNLYGVFDQLTMDRWFMRQYGRLTGTLLDFDQKKVDTATKRLARARKSLLQRNSAKVEGLIGAFENLSDAELAQKVQKASMDIKKREVLKSNPKLDEFRKASNNLAKLLEAEVEAPTPAKRRFINEVFSELQRKLKDENGIDITIADLQAVNWYPEKALYQTFKEDQTQKSAKTETSDNEQPDYESAARKLVEKQGVTKEQIDGRQIERDDTAREADQQRATELLEDDEATRQLRDRVLSIREEVTTDDLKAAEQRVVYRAGDLTNKVEPRGEAMSGRSTGHFGTGFYFFGDKGAAESTAESRNLPVTELDITGYRLAPASYFLHAALKEVNKLATPATRDGLTHTITPEEIQYAQIAVEQGPSFGDFYYMDDALRIYSDQLIDTGAARRIAAEAARLYNEPGNVDSASTSVMKALGYEGVNAVGTELDNYTYGTVIYDVKTEPKAAEQRVGDVVSRYEFRPNGSLKNASLAAELRRNLKRYGFGVKQFGTRMNDFHIVNPDTGRKVDPKKLIEKSRVEREEERLEQEEFRAEQEAIELAERERELFETEEAPFLEAIFPESDLSAAEQKADLDKGPTELERLVAYAKERGYSNAAILLSRPEAQAAIDAYEEAEKRMLKELNGVIKKTRARVDATEERVLESALGYLQGSKFYADATDVGRELMVRGLREKLGLKEKRAPSAKRIVSGPVERITITVREALNNQLKSEARGARAAAAASKAVLKQMAADITELQREGKITSKQAATVIRKFASVNVFNPVAVDNFLDYMAKVFADAEYANDIAKLRKKIPGAKKGAKRKLGRQPQLIFDILTVLAIDPTRIPVDVLPEFSKLVEILSKNKSVLALPDIQDLASSVSSILDSVNQEQSLADELADIFEAFEDKVPTKSDGVNFSETLKAMVSAGVIDEADATLMRKYKSDIVDTTRAKKTDEQLETEAKEMRSIIKDSTVNVNRLGTRLDRDAARRFEKLLGTKAVDELNNRQLENLLRVIDNINNGYLTHSAQLAIERMEAKNRGRAMSKALEGAKLNSIREIGGYLTNVKDARLGAIVRNPLELIDQVFGNFKTTPIYDATFRPIAEAAAAMMTEKGKIGERLAKAQEAVAKSHKRDPNAVVRAKYLMTTYLLQLEHESNPGNNTTPSAMAFLNATITAQEDGKTTKYNKADIGILKGIIDKYAKDGEIDAEAIYSDFNAAEKGALKTIQDINTELTPKAEFASAVIRGSAIEPVLNYLHHSVLTDETMRTDKTDALRLSEAYNQGMRPSTRAKTFVDRTPGAKPLEFDIMASVNRGVNQTLTDFYLTEPIRTARKALKETKTDNKEVLRSITNAVDGAVRNALERSVTTSNLAEKALDFVSRQGYRTMLSSIPRFASELISNLSYVALADPAAFEQGIKYRDYFGVDGADIMTNVGSAQTKRVYPSERLSGRMVDTSIMSGNMGSTTSRAGRDVENSVRQAMNYAGAYPGAVATIADTLISTPDKLIMRPLWFGAFAKAFKAETGKDVDYDAIGRNDEAYMTEYAEAIEAAKREADRVSSQAGATDNPFMGIQKGKSKSDMKPLMQTLRIANNFMSRFIIYEFTAARTGIQAAVGNGTLTQEQGARLFFAVLARMTMYSLLTPILSDMFTSLFADVPEEDEDPEQLFARALTSGLTTMAGGVMGQLGRIPVNYGIETINEKYLDFLRNGEYDPYDDYLQFNTIPDFNRGTDFADFMFPLMGAGAPMAKTAELGLKTIGREGKKRATRERYAREQMQRLPLEVLGNLGLVPFYRDVRKVLMADMYKDLSKKNKKGEIQAN